MASITRSNHHTSTIQSPDLKQSGYQYLRNFSQERDSSIKDQYRSFNNADIDTGLNSHGGEYQTFYNDGEGNEAASSYKQRSYSTNKKSVGIAKRLSKNTSSKSSVF